MIRDVLEINKMVKDGTIGAYIQHCEKDFDDRVDAIASEVAADPAANRIVLVAGPSSCGKTTFTLKLCKALEEHGIHAQTVSLDDFYLNRERAPRLENGDFDFETVESLDLEEMDRCFHELIETGSSEMPLFSFTLGRPKEERKHVELREDSVVLVEGMHALSERLEHCFPEDATLRIYISLRGNLFHGENILLDKRYLRILRRMVRDYQYRGSSPEKTLRMWMDVMDGDMLYVEPFEHTADIRVDSFFPYEAGVLKPAAVELLQTIQPNSRYYYLSRNILHKLEEVEEVSKDLLPGTSLLREFAGESIYY